MEELGRKNFASEVEAVGLSASGDFAGATLETGKIALWKAGGEADPRIIETGCAPSTGIAIDETRNCFYVTTNDEVETRDLDSGALLASTPTGFPINALVVTHDGNSIGASRGISSNGFMDFGNVQGVLWDRSCPPHIPTDDLLTTTRAISGWRWDPETLDFVPTPRFSAALHTLLQNRPTSALKTLVRLPPNFFDEQATPTTTVETFINFWSLDQLGFKPGPLRFTPLMRALACFRHFNQPAPPRDDLITSQLPFLPAPEDITSGPEALIYCNLFLTFNRPDDARPYHDRARELGCPPACQAVLETAGKTLLESEQTDDRSE